MANRVYTVFCHYEGDEPFVSIVRQDRSRRVYHNPSEASLARLAKVSHALRNGNTVEVVAGWGEWTLYRWDYL